MARRVMVGFGLWMAVFAALFYLVPAGRMIFWACVGLATSVAIVAGVLYFRPRRRRPWIITAAATLSFTAGDVIYMVLTDVLDVVDPFPSLGDVFYLMFYPLLMLGLVLLLRSGATVRDQASLLDALTLTAGLGLLSWIFIIGPLIQTPDLTAVAKTVAVAFPLFDVLLVTVLIRMATAFRRSPSVLLLTTGLAFLLVGDVLYGILQLNNAYELGGLVDLFYVIFYATFGAAAWHRSMVKLTDPRVLRPTQVGRSRVVVLGLASLIPPAVLLTEALQGDVKDGVVIAVLSAVLFGLVVARLAGVVAVHRLALAREHGLRRAGAALLAATTVAEVTSVIRTAVAELMPPGTPHRVAVTMSERDGSAAPETLPPIEMVDTTSTDAAAIAEFGHHAMAMRSPLPGRRAAGYLYVAADEGALVALQEAVQVLASQAALALEGLAANAEVVRRESEVYFRTLVLNAADVILIIDDDNQVRYASPSATAMFGSRDPVGTALSDLVAPDDTAVVQATLDSLRAGASLPELSDWTVRRGTEDVQVEVTCRDLRHEHTVAGVVITLRDITERRQLERELLHRAYYDPLTDLPNRALFTDRVERVTTAAVDSGAVVGMLLVGLDNFKVVNDTMGHEVGDELLIAAGKRLVDLVLPSPSVARMGGDEFAVLVEAAHDASEIEQVAQQIVTAFAEPFLLTAGPVTCRASVGMVTIADVPDRTQLFGRADIALATAKSADESGWCRYYSSLHARILERLQLRATLDQAISDGEFILNYQPLVELDTGKTTGLEALVRWQHPTRGLVPPLDFIDIAEESGLIVQLGAWVLKTAIHDAVRWRELRPDRPPYVSVNVSPRQFRTPGFIDLVRTELDESGLPAHCLTLEITESLFLEKRDSERVWNHLETLRSAGVRVAIDDFGTGYSSLSYLYRVPVDVVKLDKSFVDTISSSTHQFELVKGIIQLVHTLKLSVVAEGIETVEDRDLLVEAGCENGQGYFFARPMSLPDTLKWIRMDADRETTEQLRIMRESYSGPVAAGK